MREKRRDREDNVKSKKEELEKITKDAKQEEILHKNSKLQYLKDTRVR
jgi:hypothetical protein